MRQAYDCWQDQPGLHATLTKSHEKTSATSTGLHHGAHRACDFVAIPTIGRETIKLQASMGYTATSPS